MSNKQKKAKSKLENQNVKQSLNWQAIVLFLFAFLLYSNTFSFKYCLDDIYVTENNPLVSKGFSGIGEILTSPYIETYADDGEGMMRFGYRPVTKITFAIEREIFGDRPGVQHIFNVLFYALSALLLFLVLRRVFPKKYEIVAFISVLIWIAHPMHSEVVASLKNREEILSFLFMLLAFLYLIKFAEKKKYLFIIIAFCFYFLSMTSKPSSLPLAIIIPFSLYFFNKFSLKQAIFLFLSLGIPQFTFLYLENFAFDYTKIPLYFYENPLFIDKNISTILGTAAVSLLFYLKMLFVPYPSLFYYGYDMVPIVGVFSPLALMSIAIHAALLVVAVIYFKKRSLISYSIFFYLVFMAFYSNIFPQISGIVAERSLYMSLVGFAIALSFIIFKIFENIKSEKSEKSRDVKIISSSLIVVLPFVVLTVISSRDWRNLDTLYKNDIKYMEKSAKGNFLYASHFKNKILNNLNAGASPSGIQKEIDEIIYHYQKAIEIYPDYVDALDGLGNMYLMVKKDFNKAQSYFSRITVLKPEYARGWYNTAYVYHQKEEYQKAIEDYRKSLQFDAGNLNAMSNISLCYVKLQDYVSAINCNNEILSVNPNFVTALKSNVNCYIHLGNEEKAIENLEKLYNIEGNQQMARQLYSYFMKTGQTEKAQKFRQNINIIQK